MDDKVRTRRQIASQIRKQHYDTEYKKYLRSKTEQLPDAVNLTINGRSTLSSAGSKNDPNQLFRNKDNNKRNATIRNNSKLEEKLKAILRKNTNRKIESIKNNKNYLNESAAPMDNTQVVYQLPSGKTMSTYIHTPLQLVAALSEKTIHPIENAIFTGATAAPLIAFSAPSIASGAMYTATHPIATSVGFGAGALGNKAVNLGINYFSDGKYTSFGDLMGTDSDSKFLWEFANPGGLIGGIKGWNIGRGGDKAINTYRLAREFNKSVKNFDGTVGESYFHAPDKWYRITSSPEIYGIKELGMNVTTYDLPDFPNSADNFRTFVHENNLIHGTGKNEGYWILPKNVRELVLLKKIAEETGGDTDWIIFPNDFRKYGASHGNRTLGAWQLKWEGSTIADADFPEYVLEGNPLPDLTIPFGKGRSKFRITPIEDVEAGSRIGFTTGEMPILGLRQFRLLPNGRYKYEGELIPDKIIKTDGTSTLIPRIDAMPSFLDALTLHDDLLFIRAYNNWNRFGYPEIPKSIINDPKKVEAFAKGMLNRHNTFARGVTVLPDEKAALELALGRKVSDDEFLRISATSPRIGQEGVADLWITPYTELAGIYGGGKVALVRRPFTLGTDRMKWFDEASFNVQHNPKTAGDYTDIMAPWNNAPVVDFWGKPQGIINSGPESELVSPIPMKFIEFVKGSPHMNHRTSRNSNPLFTKGDNHFDPKLLKWIIDTYKKGGKLIKKFK